MEPKAISRRNLLQSQPLLTTMAHRDGSKEEIKLTQGHGYSYTWASKEHSAIGQDKCSRFHYRKPKPHGDVRTG